MSPCPGFVQFADDHILPNILPSAAVLTQIEFQHTH